MTKIFDFYYPFHDLCGWYSCPKHKLKRAFVVGVNNDDEKVASSEKHSQFKNRVLEPYPNCKTKVAQIDTLFMTKTAENSYPLRPHIPK